jgi:hypothetical protein
MTDLPSGRAALRLGRDGVAQAERSAKPTIGTSPFFSLRANNSEMHLIRRDIVDGGFEGE